MQARTLGTLLGIALLASGASAAQGHLLGPVSDGLFGEAVALAGDLDGDGTVDIVVGAPADPKRGPWTGSVSAISLSKGVVLWRHYGSAPGDKLGAAVSGAGDVDGDGCDDVLVGLPGDDTPLGESTGSARLLSGKDGRVLYYWYGYKPFDHFGTSVAGGMDLDNDGWPDLLVGATLGGDADPLNGKSQQGSVHVISGSCKCTVRVVEGEFSGDYFGQSLTFLGDVDGDGAADWAAGAPFGVTEGQRLGYVQVRSGRNGNLLDRIHGPQDGAHFGWSVAGIGDATLDGRPDLVVGAPEYSANGTTRDGRVQVFGLQPWTVVNDVVGTKGSRFGTSVAGVGDASGDGAADFAVGAPLHSTPYMDARGAVYVWRGNLPMLLDWWEGSSQASRFGASVAGLGNIDAFPMPELLVGVPQDSTNGLAAGASVVLSLD